MIFADIEIEDLGKSYAEAITTNSTNATINRIVLLLTCENMT